MLVLAIALLIIHVLFHKKYFDVAALLLLLLTLIIYPVARLITIGWLKFSELLGKVNSTVILSVMFFVFLVPISYFYRLFNRDQMQLKKKNENSSGYYYHRNHQYEAKDFDKTF